MTTEEIKAAVSMRDVLAKYGVSINRNGMCKCPIHGEKHPSMKVFADGYKCFACGSGGDIFRFIQDMEKCDFKTAFVILGGTYKHQTDTARNAARLQFRRNRQRKQQAIVNEKRFKTYLLGAIGLCEWWIEYREPFSDDWCFAKNKLPWLWHVYETKYIEGEGVDEANVYRKCRDIRQRFITV